MKTSGKYQVMLQAIIIQVGDEVLSEGDSRSWDEDEEMHWGGI